MSRVKINYQSSEYHFINGVKVQPNNGTQVYQIVNPSNEVKIKTVVLDDISIVDSAVESSKQAYLIIN